MKNRYFFLLALIVLTVMLFSAFNAAWAAAADPIIVLVNGRPLELDVAPLIEAGRTLVPVRAIAESLGAFVGWDDVARRVNMTLNNNELTLLIDNDIAYVNGLPRQLDAPARIVDGRTLVPARFISESFHAEVGWDDVTRTVIITTYEDAPSYSAALTQLEATVLQELNQRRAKLARAALNPVEELQQMARSHAAELALNNAITHISPRFGDTAARAAARGVTVHFEYLACGLPDAASIVDALLSGEHGARLLAEEALFLGLGLYKKAEAGNADIYVVVELTEGTGFFQGPRLRRLDTEDMTLEGYATPAAPLTLYLLNEDGDYISRFGYTLNVDGASRFSLRLNLPQPGHYAAVVGQDSVVVIYE